ncbi:MAG: Uncharacterised protein [Hyphomonas sp. TMED17]|nr:MAG: Uncharacterised protein [Hyphomonas sp. TMED17]
MGFDISFKRLVLGQLCCERAIAAVGLDLGGFELLASDPMRLFSKFLFFEIEIIVGDRQCGEAIAGFCQLDLRVFLLRLLARNILFQTNRFRLQACKILDRSISFRLKSCQCDFGLSKPAAGSRLGGP